MTRAPGGTTVAIFVPAEPYEEWSKEQLQQRAQEVGIEGRSDMTKDELIDALRDRQ